MRRQSHEDAATAVEYALLAGFIAAAIATAVGAVGDALIDIFQGFLNSMGWG